MQTGGKEDSGRYKCYDRKYKLYKRKSYKPILIIHVHYSKHSYDKGIQKGYCVCNYSGCVCIHVLFQSRIVERKAGDVEWKRDGKVEKVESGANASSYHGCIYSC